MSVVAEQSVAVGLEVAPATVGRPSWSAVDGLTGDLLAELAGPSRDSDWDAFCNAVRELAAKYGGLVDPNLLRPMLRDAGVHPQRRGGLYYRAAHCERFLAVKPNTWVLSTDRESRNAGKPIRVWLYVADNDPGARRRSSKRRTTK